MTDREDLLQWLLGLPLGVGVAVDDGGLTLVTDAVEAAAPKDIVGPYYEVGGVPLPEDREEATGMCVGPRFSALQFKTLLEEHVDSMRRLVDACMQHDGDKEEDSQRICVLNRLRRLDSNIIGITDSDMKS